MTMEHVGIAAIGQHRFDLPVERSNDLALMRMIGTYYQCKVQHAKLSRHEPIGVL